MRGDRLDREQECVEEDAFALCGACICHDIEVVYQAPDGTCWFFTGDCLGDPTPPGWTYDETGALCPEMHDWQSGTGPLPPC
jgi:hypothetical protein